jgi:hypothetical protein
MWWAAHGCESAERAGRDPRPPALDGAFRPVRPDSDRIGYPDKPNLGPVHTGGRFTLTPAGWKLTRESFCIGMSIEFPGCPTT